VNDRTDDERALRAMVSVLREEPTPQPDWDAVEQRLSVRIEDEVRVSRLHAPPRPVSPFRTALPMLAAAAAIVLAVGLGGSEAPAPAHAEARVVAPSLVPLAPGEAGAKGEHDLAALRVGDVVETGEAGTTFALAGSVRWSLEPQSRVVVRAAARAPALGDAEGGHVVALERGSIRAEVVPRDAKLGLVEAFAVEVDGTRVAVHGTAFSVTRTVAGLVVDVEHGAVAVGPVGHQGTTSGHLLVGPARASFSADGGRVARNLSREEPLALGAASSAAGAPPSFPVAAPTPLPSVTSLASSGAPGRTAAVPAPARPAPDATAQVDGAAHPSAEAPVAPLPATTSLEAVRAGLQRCFAQTYDGASGLALSVSSTLHVALRDDGTVQSAWFDPPLKPEFQACASGLLGGRFPDGPRSLNVPLSFSR
jgi:hypothetical protein